jgi:hypothetical protein
VLGVLCHDDELARVREFFELFKTPWTRYEQHGSYDLVLVTMPDAVASVDARLVIAFAPPAVAPAAGARAGARAGRDTVTIESEGIRIPLYCGVRALAGGSPRARLAPTGEPAVVELHSDGRTVIRCGYNLVSEVDFLLSTGQPAEHADTPTLDLHIALLRRWITDAGVSFLEIPPVPAGCDVLACLTHDVDFLGIKRHRFDRTLCGFLYRATVGSMLDVLARRRRVGHMLKNWVAVLALPLVHAGLLEDPWLPFDRYAAAERDLRSTFFLVPFGGRTGRRLGAGEGDPRRAVPYGVAEARSEVERLIELGFEVGVHGIDAWSDADQARAERDAVTRAGASGPLGIRMHWLYFDEAAPAKLDQAGFDYDATMGYNDAIGFRAGTAQVFRPASAEHLLELPLLVQDTALLFPRRMHLREQEALERTIALIDTTRELGGVMTISWHERSLVPERQWDGVYRGLLDALQGRGATVLRARDVVSWFRARRAVDLEGADLEGALTLHQAGVDDVRPHALDLRVRAHRPGAGASDVPISVERLQELVSLSRVARV